MGEKCQEIWLRLSAKLPFVDMLVLKVSSDGIKEPRFVPLKF